MAAATFPELLQQLEALHTAELQQLQSKVFQLKAELMHVRDGGRDPVPEEKPDSDESLTAHEEESLPVVLACPRHPRDAEEIANIVHGEFEDSADLASIKLEARPPNSSAVKSRPKRAQLPFVRHENGLRTSIAATSKLPVMNRVRKVVLSRSFDFLFCILIFLNAIVMAFEVQYQGIELKAALQYGGGEHQFAAEVWPEADVVFDVLQWIFGILFTMEMSVKVLVLGPEFFKDLWNWLDLVAVAVWILGKLSTGVVPINAQVLRLARLARLVRAIRLVRTIQQFDALFLMTQAIRGSASILVWMLILMLVVQSTCALLMSQCLHEFYFTDSSKPLDERQQVYTYFGSFTRSLLSMFEITLANWPPICRILSEKVSESFMILAIVHKLTLGFAFVGVINGVFMQETFQVAATDDTVMVNQKTRATNNHVQKMRRLFVEADESGDGRLDLNEFRKIMQLQEVKTWLSAMELDTADVDRLFSLLDAGSDGTLSADELVNGSSRLKGAARSMDLAALMREHDAMMNLLQGLFGRPTVSVMTSKCDSRAPHDGQNGDASETLHLQTNGKHSEQTDDLDSDDFSL